jgi:hypothetical protein
MADDKTKIGEQDRIRVASGQQYEVRHLPTSSISFQVRLATSSSASATTVKRWN